MKVKNNKIYLGKNSVQDLVKKYGTPLYVYEADVIKQRYSELLSSIKYPKLSIHYACKENTNIDVMRFLRTLGSKIEAVSSGEIEQAFLAGFKSDDIIYTSTSMTEKEMSFIVKNKISINLDSLHQIELYGKMNPGAKIGIRINQGIGAGGHGHLITGGSLSKFGIPLEHIDIAKKLAQKYNLKIVRLHQHIGSNILDVCLFLKAFDKLLETALTFDNLETLDFGGGLGVPYKPNEKSLDVKKLGTMITKKMNDFCIKYGRELDIVFEPGRFLIAEAGTLIAQVVDVKKNPTRTFIGLDTGMNHLVRPSMYGAYHHITNGTNLTGKKIKADIVGNICESGDILGRDRMIVSPKIGDIILIHTAGCGGFVMASHYNTRPLPQEIFLK